MCSVTAEILETVIDGQRKKCQQLRRVWVAKSFILYLVTLNVSRFDAQLRHRKLLGPIFLRSVRIFTHCYFRALLKYAQRIRFHCGNNYLFSQK